MRLDQRNGEKMGRGARPVWEEEMRWRKKSTLAAENLEQKS
jgi:hypothetical protein